MASKKGREHAWRVAEHSSIDKIFAIEGPDGFNLHVNYDDVCRPAADTAAKMIARVLNKHLPSLPRHGDLPDHEC